MSIINVHISKMVTPVYMLGGYFNAVWNKKMCAGII